MVITARRQEARVGETRVSDIEADHILIETLSSLHIAHPEVEMAHHRACWRPERSSIAIGGIKESLSVERLGGHGYAICRLRPLGPWSISVDLNAVALRVA